LPVYFFLTSPFTRSYKGSFPMSKRSSKPVAEKLEIVLLYLEQGILE
ncbi:hypothetical protein SMU102_09256, partial [Streptococcus mutans S1B]